jgi:hypothetical protein
MNYRTYIVRPESGPDTVVVFDAVLRETHEGEVEVTEHPVETGADIADHARVKLSKLTLEVFITNHPIDEGAQFNSDGATAKFGPLSVEYEANVSLPIGIPMAASVMGAFGLDKHKQKETINVLQSSQPFDRVSHVYTVLEQIRTKAELVSVLTPLRLYENILITHVTAPREAGHPYALSITVECKPMRFVTAQTGAAVPGKKKSKGQQPATPATDDDPQAKVSATFAAKGYDALVAAVRKYL